MYNIQGFDYLFHRSKDRIRDMGEVFTPEKYVQEMLSLLEINNKNLWSDPSITFFEPCCGHGNFVFEIIKKKIIGLYEYAISENLISPEYYAIANAINSIWAIDLDTNNIKECRQRVLQFIFLFLSKGENKIGKLKIILSNKKFFNHLICAINWHIFENETLSALSDPKNAIYEASKTKLGGKWVSKNQLETLNLNETWAYFFEECAGLGEVPIIYQRATKFIDNILETQFKGFNEFDYVKSILLNSHQD